MKLCKTCGEAKTLDSFSKCSRKDIEPDNGISLSLGGTDFISNLQVLCERHNRAKGNRSCADYRNLELVI